jgi:hypothetical protein
MSMSLTAASMTANSLIERFASARRPLFSVPVGEITVVAAVALPFLQGALGIARSGARTRADRRHPEQRDGREVIFCAEGIPRAAVKCGVFGSGETGMHFSTTPTLRASRRKVFEWPR